MAPASTHGLEVYLDVVQSSEPSEMGEVSTSCGRKITFGDITEDNVHHLRKMNTSIFPVRYHDKFYIDVSSANSDFTQYGEGVIISNIVMRWLDAWLDPCTTAVHVSYYTCCRTHIYRRLLQNLVYGLVFPGPSFQLVSSTCEHASRLLLLMLMPTLLPLCSLYFRSAFALLSVRG